MSHLGGGISSADAAAEAPRHAREVYGVVAEFDTPAALLNAVAEARTGGYERLEAYTPFPIHGIDEAMGAKRSRLGYLVLALGLVGAGAALLLIWWTGAVDYPLVIGGKPLFDITFSIPIAFELAVLFGAFGAVFGMLAVNGLPRLYHPIFQHPRFARATDDKFLLAIEAGESEFQAGDAAEFLRDIGGKHVEVIAE